MTLNEIAYNLLNLIRGGKSHHDENISLDQIKFNVRHYRAVLVRRDFQRNGMITRHLEQSLGCMELEKVDGSQCCGLDIGCMVYKTKLPVPRTLRFNFEDAITFVGAADGLTRIPLVSSSIIKYVQYEKYTSEKKKAYMIGDYLYVFNAEGMEYVNIRGVFENPEDLSMYDCDGSDCYDDNSEYPLPADMLQAINSGLMQGELRMLGITRSDTTNDRMPGAHADAAAAPAPKSKEQN
tara:strand:- start:1642 stop:2352 length:711 start_codon:yes stop_codon:yes gene_type:complete